MASQLPDRLVDEITDFFLLGILKEEDRKTLCLDAHFTRPTAPSSQKTGFLRLSNRTSEIPAEITSG